MAIDTCFSSPLAANGYAYRNASEIVPAERDGDNHPVSPVDTQPPDGGSAKPVFDKDAIDSDALAVRHRQAAALSAFAAAYAGPPVASGSFVTLSA